MRYKLLTLLLSPVFLFSQNVGIGTTDPTEKLEVNGIIFTSQGGVKFPDGTIQTTAYTPTAGMMQMNLTGLVVEFASSPQVNVVGPANDGEIQDGLNVTSAYLSSSFMSGNQPAISDVAIERQADFNSAHLNHLLLTQKVIPHIEVFTLAIYSDPSVGYFINHWQRYENCTLTKIEFSTFDTDDPNESIFFKFEKACYRSYQRDVDGNQVGPVNESCFDLLTNSANCCNW